MKLVGAQNTINLSREELFLSADKYCREAAHIDGGSGGGGV